MDLPAPMDQAFVEDRDSFMDRLFGDALGAFNVFAVYIGDRLGFYRELSKNGAVIIMDERSMDAFQACAESLEKLLYGFSILHCLPSGMTEQPSAATGTVMRRETLQQYAQQAGFSRVEVLDIDNFFFRFYRLWS